MILFNEEWATKRLCEAVPTTYSTADISIASCNEKGLRGGVLFKEFTEESVRMSAVGFCPNWICRELIWAVFDYGFNQLKVERMWTGTNKHNTPALILNRRLGFKYKVEIAGIYKNNTPVVIHMLERGDCKWLSLKSRAYRRNVGQDA